MKTETGINYQYKLLMGVSELAYAAFMPEEQRRMFLRGRMAEAGLVLSPAACGNPGLPWRVEQFVAGDPLVLRFARAVGTNSMVNAGVLADGSVIIVEPDEGSTVRELSEITVPDDGVWYTLVVKRETTAYEPGTATFTASSTTVVGVGTKFTRLSSKTGDGLPVGDKLRVASGGNAGVDWEVDDVVSDTELTLVNPATATQSAAVRVSGSWYLDDIPTTPSAHRNPLTTFELLDARYLPDPDEYLVLADVMLDTGASAKIQIIDRRTSNMLRMLPDFNATRFIPRLLVSMGVASCNDAPPFTEDTYYQEMVAETRPVIEDGGGAGDSVTWTSVAPTSDGLGMLMVSTHINYIRATQYDPASSVWPDWDALSGSQVRPDTSGVPRAAHLAAVPAASGATHILVYQAPAAQTIYYRTSSDDGASWSSQAAIINDTSMVSSAAVGASSPTPVILTRAGRMWVFYGFDNGTTQGIKAVYSDTYGATWNTNAGAGHIVLSRADASNTWAIPQDVTETEDGRMAILVNDRPSSGGDLVMCVLLTVSTTDATWDPGDDVASATPSGPDTVRVVDPVYDEPPYVIYGQAQPSAIVGLNAGAFAVVHNHYYADGVNGLGKTWVTVVGRYGSKVDPDISSRRTLQILQHSEVNWYQDTSVVTAVPNAISARQMPNGEVAAIVRREITSRRYDQLNLAVTAQPLGLVVVPAAYSDLNP